MKLLLDTTYFLPAIGIAVKGLARDAVIKLLPGGRRVLMSEVTLFELSAKGAKHVAEGKIEAERVLRGLRAIAYDERIEKVSMHDTAILLTAFKLRKMLNDFIDCIILSSGINEADILVTEDEDMQRLTVRKDFQELIETINPTFTVQTMADTLKQT